MIGLILEQQQFCKKTMIQIHHLQDDNIKQVDIHSRTLITMPGHILLLLKIHPC